MCSTVVPYFFIGLLLMAREVPLYIWYKIQLTRHLVGTTGQA